MAEARAGSQGGQGKSSGLSVKSDAAIEQPNGARATNMLFVAASQWLEDQSGSMTDAQATKNGPSLIEGAVFSGVFPIGNMIGAPVNRKLFGWGRAVQAALQRFNCPASGFEICSEPSVAIAQFRAVLIFLFVRRLAAQLFKFHQ